MTNQAQYIAPRLGRGSILILGLMLIAAVVVSAACLRQARLFAPVAESFAISPVRVSMWLTGMTYGVAAGVCWLATMLRFRYLRWGARAAIVIALAAVQRQLETDDWLRGLSNLGGLVCCQCMLFHWFGVPIWNAAGRSAAHRGALRRDQFGIAEIAIAMACVALLLKIATHFQTPIDPFGYWLVLVLFWVVGPMIAACLALSMLCRQGLPAGWLALAVVLAAACVFGLTEADLRLAERAGSIPRENAGIIASSYAQIVLVYLSTFALFCVAAKTDVVVATEAEPELDI